MARKITTKKVTDSAKSSINKKIKRTAALTRKPKKESPKVTQMVEEAIVKTPTVKNSTGGGRSVKVHRSTVFVVIGIVLIALILYYGRGLFVAAVVNGQPVSRLSLVKEAERESGKQAMAMLVRNILVEQEASRQNVKVSDKELSDQIKTIENNLSKQGQSLDATLKSESMSREDLDRIVRLDLMVGKLVGKEIKITDKDVADYIDKNKDFLPKDQKTDALNKLVRERIKQEQLSGKAQIWLADLEKKASIFKFVDY